MKDSKQRVTVKKCLSVQPSVKEPLLKEVRILKQLKHTNIVKLISTCNNDESIYVVLEMIHRNFLWFLQEPGNSLTTGQLTSFLLDAAMGMEYLTSQNFAHINLSARSCMIGLNDHGTTVLKIFDFSMCRKVKNGLLVIQDDTKNYISIRWTAPEVHVCDM